MKANVDPMSNPWPVAFPLLKLGLTRHSPCDEWFADAGKMHVIDYARRSDDAGFDFPPRFAVTRPQTFPADVTFVCFGGRCYRNLHGRRIIDATEKARPFATGWP